MVGRGTLPRHHPPVGERPPAARGHVVRRGHGHLEVAGERGEGGRVVLVVHGIHLPGGGSVRRGGRGIQAIAASAGGVQVVVAAAVGGVAGLDDVAKAGG